MTCLVKFLQCTFLQTSQRREIFHLIAGVFAERPVGEGNLAERAPEQREGDRGPDEGEPERRGQPPAMGDQAAEA